GTILALGTLSLDRGKATLLYNGDGKHTNLLSIIQSVFVTLENQGTTPSAPTSTTKLYQASTPSAFFPAIQHLLYTQPNFPTSSSLMVGLFEAIKSMNDKASSLVDSLQTTHDYPLAQRQATRIIEMIDGSQYASTSGDLPGSIPGMLTVPVGLLSSPTVPGYLDRITEQLHTIQQTADKHSEQFQYAQHVSNAITDLQDWLQKLRTFDVQILKSAHITDLGNINAALQLKQLADDVYTGRTIPPNGGPLPILGSAGAYQAYTQCQYLAALNMVKVS
ncbi:MAG: hypothetical protein M3Z24_04130, partial [Chloroflexota bacterium]|nr:hypothetical protein [Chloroflexota bacterium]